jgi:hypothetical protein
MLRGVIIVAASLFAVLAATPAKRSAGSSMEPPSSRDGVRRGGRWRRRGLLGRTVSPRVCHGGALHRDVLSPAALRSR